MSSPRAVMLIGRAPPESSMSTRASPARLLRKTVTVSLPPLAANRNLALRPRLVGEDSPLRLASTRPLAESSGVPVPVPPVAESLSRASVPLGARLNVVIALAPGSLVIEKTAPGLASLFLFGAAWAAAAPEPIRAKRTEPSAKASGLPALEPHDETCIEDLPIGCVWLRDTGESSRPPTA